MISKDKATDANVVSMIVNKLGNLKSLVKESNAQ